MGVHKLDIEFEDEDDAKAKEEASRAAAAARKVVDCVDLEFGAVENSGFQQQVEEGTLPAMSDPSTKILLGPMGQAAPVQTSQYMHASPGSANYNLGDELRSIIEGNRILEIELMAKVEIAVSHRLTSIIAKTAQENKALETKVNKILIQLAAKAPGLKKELLMIQRLLAENATVDKSKIKSKEAAKKKKTS